MTERGYLGEVLEELRLERGMSLSQLAEASGVSKGYLSALESGKQKNPSLEKLMALSEALGVSITVSRDEPGYIRVSEGSPPCVSVVRSGVPTVQEEIEEAKEEAVIGFKAKMDEWPKGLRPIKWEAAKAEAKTYKPGAEGYQRVYVEVAPCQAVEANTEPVVVGHAIGVDFAHGPGKAVTTVWRVQDGKFDVVETVEDPLAKAVELLDAIRGQVGEGDDAESFKMRLAQRVAQELVDLLRWRADRVDQRTENGRRARLHNNAMVSMLAFNDDFTAWREDVMVASGKRRDPDAGKKRSE
jgi:transcriptional regulator with XRE-family HTH domain